MLVVRPEAAADHEAVYQIVLAAFGQPDEANLVNRARPLPGVISLVAEKDGTLVGHILFSPVTLHDPNGQLISIKITGLAPVAVTPDLQKSGVGKALITAGLEACRQVGFVACVLLGHPTYYPKFGFQPAQSIFGIGSTYSVPDPVFMALELVPDSLKEQSGTIHYHPTFAGI